MESQLLWIFAMYLIIGVIFIAISIPLVLEKIPPNNYYGFRTKKTLSNKDIWFKVNKLTGKDLIKCGLIIILGTIILWLEQKSLSIDEFAWIGLGFTIIPLCIAIIRGFLYINELENKNSNKP